MLEPQFRRALAYVVPYWRRLLLVFVLSLSSTGLALYVPYLSRSLVDGALLGGDGNALRRIVLTFAIITVASFALNVVSGLRYTRVSADILFDMRLALYRHLQRLSPRFFASTRLGDIMSRINNDISEIQRVASEVVLATLGNVIFLAGSLGMLVWLDLRLFLVSALFLPPSLWALVRYRRRLEGRVRTVRERSADIGSFLIETIQGMKLVVTSNAQVREAGRFRQRNDAFVEALMSMQWVTYLSGGLPGLILSGSTAIIFLYGGSRVIDGTITMGTLVAFMAYQMRVLPPVQALMGLYASLATAKVSLGRVQELLDANVDVIDTPESARLNRVDGRVTIEHVTVSFGRGAPLLDDVSIEVAPGEVLAVVGPSGSGKSTLTELLLRLIDPDQGRVLLDGRDLREVPLREIRRHIALVDQEPFLFHASLLENLRYASPEATDEDLAAAVRAAGLEAFIVDLPEGYATQVGEGGRALSTGERQRVAIARAFLAAPAVLVLDEPTASLDPSMTKQVMTGYEALMRGRTTVVVSHRLELALQADRVVVLDGANVVEQGAPSELMARDGAFVRLFDTSSTTNAQES
ncbi:MAG: ABC transporter ATP-binding protein [Vicinamibacterales bacterium]|nr:ABC transporter [Acidobacteriota bacterium]MDP7210663.1 ABC transporter ATP-binding protein [Vicinamibacterales bacterium]HJO17409.1 ABC transporter ATP-binding protein [Vicinamibacterales bacterium]